jgi:hypothetical protein
MRLFLNLLLIGKQTTGSVGFARKSVEHQPGYGKPGLLLLGHVKMAGPRVDRQAMYPLFHGNICDLFVLARGQSLNCRNCAAGAGNEDASPRRVGFHHVATVRHGKKLNRGVLLQRFAVSELFRVALPARPRRELPLRLERDEICKRRSPARTWRSP